jgi:fatty-acid desaturase
LYFSIITYNISLTATKISILLQYHRIFTLREMRIPVYVALVIVSAWGTTTLFTSIFSCVPINAYWNVAEPPKGAKCIHRTA